MQYRWPTEGDPRAEDVHVRQRVSRIDPVRSRRWPASFLETDRRYASGDRWRGAGLSRPRPLCRIEPGTLHPSPGLGRDRVSAGLLTRDRARSGWLPVPPTLTGL